MIFEYLKKYVRPNGFIFVQETHSSKNDIKNWEKEFGKGKFFLLIEKKVFGDVDQFLWDEKSWADQKNLWQLRKNPSGRDKD